VCVKKVDSNNIELSSLKPKFPL